MLSMKKALRSPRIEPHPWRLLSECRNQFSRGVSIPADQVREECISGICGPSVPISSLSAWFRRHRSVLSGLRFGRADTELPEMAAGDKGVFHRCRRVPVQHYFCQRGGSGCGLNPAFTLV